MPCCGKARNPVPITSLGGRKNSTTIATPTQVKTGAAPAQWVYFKYFGTTGISVKCPASSRVYRFAPNGGPIAVDPRDAPSLARVLNLRPVRHS